MAREVCVPLLPKENLSRSTVGTLEIFDHFFLFEQLQLTTDFLDKAPELWEADQSFKNCQWALSNLKVVNYISERGVALIE